MVDISILLPTKDRPDRLKRAVTAILAQEGPTFEIIINNGGGPIPEFDDDRVTVINRSTPIGRVLNHSASYATGRLMHVSCDDDVMQSGTLADAAALDAEWCYGRMQFIRDGMLGEAVGGLHWSLSEMQQRNIVLAPTVFWTRALWDEVGPFDESLTYVWDYEMWSRFGTKTAPAIRSHIDYHYELWAGSVSSTCTAEIAAEVRTLQDRWQAIGFGNRP